jgi:hypothetical protein
VRQDARLDRRWGASAVALPLVVVVLGAWLATREAGGHLARVIGASETVRSEVLTSLHLAGSAKVAVFVLAGDQDRGSVCSEPGRISVVEKRFGHWHLEQSELPAAWAQPLLTACPYVP